MSLIFDFQRIPDGKTAPTRFMLVRDGDMEWEGKDLVFDATAAKTIIEAFKEHGNQLPIDYHHHTLGAESESSESEAPAAGWIRKLEWVDGDGLYASEVEWTDKARGQIEAKEFKYWSPVLYSSKKTGKWTELHSVALTNRPRTKRMTELLLAAAKASAQMENETMADEPAKGQEGADSEALVAKLREKLGLEADASIEAVLMAAIESVGEGGEGEGEGEGEGSKGEADSASLGKVAAALKCDASPEAIEKSIAELQVKAGKHDAESERIAALEKANADREETEAESAAKALVDEQVEAGRLLPDDKTAIEAAHKLAKSDPDGFVKVMGKTPPKADPTQYTKHGGTSRPKDSRDAVIQAASKEFPDRADFVRECGVANYVDAALEEEGHAKLSEAERESMKKKEN